MMLEIVAVGAIAITFELRMPCRSTLLRSASQSSRWVRSWSRSPPAVRSQDLDRVDRQDAPAPQRSVERRVAAALRGQVATTPRWRSRRAAPSRCRRTRPPPRTRTAPPACTARRRIPSAPARPGGAQVRPAGRRDRVEVDVDDVVEHPHGRRDGARGAARRRARRGPTWAARLTEPRLQTAVSARRTVFRVISVHRFDECTTPTCCCGDRRLHGSLNVIHGCPVSNSMVSIRRHSSTARTRRNTRISPRSAAASYSRVPLGERRRRTGRAGPAPRPARTASTAPSASTRRRNSSGIQFAVFMSCVRRRSSPVFLRRSRNSSMSTCHVSRYAQTAPLRLPPWLTATAVSLAIFRNGTTP